MKKIYLAATLIVALASAAFADGKNLNAKFLGDLKNALKNVNQSSWITTNSYKKAQFTVNETNVSAYLNAETDELIGFAVVIIPSALPAGALENIAKKYQDWQIVNSIMFITASGTTSYFVQVSKGKNSLALSISDKGQPNFYSRFPH